MEQTTNRLKNAPKHSGIAPRTDPERYCPQRFSLRKSDKVTDLQIDKFD
jgi:hypothetical protein